MVCPTVGTITKVSGLTWACGVVRPLSNASEGHKCIARSAARCRELLGACQQQRRQLAQSTSASRRLPARAQGGACLDQAQEDGRERRYVRALVLAYLASLNRSLFAAKCLVEVVVEMYREGVTLEDAKLLLSLASLQQGGQLLGPMDEDILVNYVAVIMIALEMVGVPLKPEGEARMRELGRRNPADDEAGLIAGLRGMVRVAVDQFLAGTDLFRLQLQQSMAAKMGGEAGGFSPAVQMLQQNTRLVIIALEVVRGMGLPTTVALQEPPPPGPAGEAQEPDQAQLPQRHWVPGFLRACDPEAASGGSADEQQRAAAVRLLISFMGAAQGFLYPAWDFVQQAIECYSNGWSADDVYSRLRDEEFAQSGGMALQVARLPGTPNLTAAVFARFLSIVYMTLAQLGVIFPGAARQEGWAWVSGAAEMHAAEEASATSLEAYGLADFVLNTIRNEERKEREGRGAAAAGAASGVEAEGVLARPSPNQLQQQQREGFVSIEDPSLLASSPAVLVMSQQISLVQMARQLVLREREQAAAPPAAA